VGLDGTLTMLVQSSPIMVRVVEQQVESTSVSDILIGALGLTGALLLAAAVLGLLLGGVLVGIKLLRARYNLEPVPDSEAMRVTPTRL
jgi:uncharacterized protein YacL